MFSAEHARSPTATVLAILLAFCLASFSGCDGNSKPEGGGKETEAGSSKGIIAISVLTLTNPYFKVLADSVKSEAAANGYETIITSGDFDVAKQRDQVKDFIVKKAKAIILCPCDTKAVGAAITEATTAGIPVFTADLACTAPGVDVKCHIATDNYDGGKLAGKAMIEALGEAGGKVLILHFKQAESCLFRVKGFREVIEAYNKGRTSGKIDIVLELEGGGVKDQGFNATQDALQAHSDLAGIFAINDPSALGAYAALENAKKTDQIKIVAFDGQPEGKQAIKEGKIYADPVQFPDQIGRTTVQTILKYFRGEKIPKEILIPTKLYRKADGEKDPDLKD